MGLDVQRAVRDHRDHVLRVLGKVEIDDGAPAGAEREPRNVVVLPQIGGDAERLGDRRGDRRSDGEPADLPRRREIAFHQGRRDSQHAGDVVEAVAGVVGRQQVADVDVETDEVPDDVAVLRAAEPMERLGPPRPHIGGGGPVQLGLEPRAQAVVGGPVRPGPRVRRHGPRPQLADHLLPDRRLAGDVGQVDGFERQPAGLEPVVVAGDAVPVEQLAPAGRVGGLSGGQRPRSRGRPADQRRPDGGADDPKSRHGPWFLSGGTWCRRTRRKPILGCGRAGCQSDAGACGPPRLNPGARQ